MLHYYRERESERAREKTMPKMQCGLHLSELGNLLCFLLYSLRGMGWSGEVLWKPHSSDGKGIAKLHTYLVLDDTTEFSFSRQQKRSPVKEMFVLRFILFIVLCMLCIWVYTLFMHVQCMCRFSQRFWIPSNWSSKPLWAAWCMCWELNLGL